jgi:hypothetical protein
MSQPYKSGRQKNLNLGISSVTENDTILQVTGKVGIGTTSAYDRSLYVIGPGEITGITSLASSGGITTTGGDLYVGRDAYVKRNLVISGITTFQSDVDIDGSLNVDTNVTVTGLSTFTGITTNQSTIFGRQLSISGVSTFVGIITSQTTLFANNLSVAGLSTFVGITTNQSTIFGRQLNISGVSTFIGITTSNSTIFATQLSVVGPSTFVGLVTVSNDLYVNRNLYVTGISTFRNGPVIVGSATSSGTADQKLQITGGAYVSGSVGVGTTNPRETLDVIGTVGVQASGSANRFEIQHNAALNSLDFIFV